MRDIEKYATDILRDVHPRELSLEELAALAGVSRTSMAKHVEALKERGVVTTRKSLDALYIALKKE